VRRCTADSDHLSLRSPASEASLSKLEETVILDAGAVAGAAPWTLIDRPFVAYAGALSWLSHNADESVTFR
jgi:hypothetical protein